MKTLILTLLTTLLVQGGNFASGVLAARLLGPEGRGDLAAAQLWPTTLAYMLLLGLNDAALYFSATAKLKDRQVFATGLWSGLIVSAVAILICWFGVVPHVYPGNKPELLQAVFLLLGLIPCHILGLIFQDMLRGKGMLGLWNLIRITLALGYPLAIAALWLLGERGLLAVAGAYLLAHLPTVIIPVVALVRRGWGGITPKPEAAKEMLAYGGRIYASGLIYQANSRIDQWLIQTYLPSAALGFYVVATSVSQIPVTLAYSVAQIAFPRACAESDPAARGAVVGLYLRLTLALMIAASGVLWLIAPLFLRLVFGAEYAEASDLVRWLILGILPLTIREFQALAFKAWNRTLALSINEGLTLALNAGLLLVLLPIYGLNGAAVSFVAVRWAQVLVLGALAWKHLHLSPATLFLPTAQDGAMLRQAWGKLRRR
jgi:O-antigen/teichoic acid export membrane protein